MDEMLDMEQGKQEKSRKKGLIWLLGVTTVFVVLGLMYVYGINMAWGSRMIDDRDTVALECAKAIYAQASDCYEAQGKTVPADKEYLVRATCTKDGLVNEPCELLPQSETNAYYSRQWKTTFNIAVRFRDGVPAEAWSLEKKPLTDDMLRSYSREEQREMFGKLKGARDVIGYSSFKDVVWKNK